MKTIARLVSLAATAMLASCVERPPAPAPSPAPVPVQRPAAAEPVPPALSVPAADRVHLLNEPAAWTAHTAPGTTLHVDGVRGQFRPCLRMRYDFAGTMSYVVAARAANLALPENFELGFSLRRTSPDDRLELKLVDEAGNIHQYKWYEYGPAGQWSRIVIRRDQFEFTSGPDGQAPLRRLARIEIANTGGLGQGEMCFDELTVTPLAPGAAARPSAAPRANVPRWVNQQQAYWTLAGVPEDDQEALLSEDGMIEPYKRGFALVPSLLLGDRWVTYADAVITQSLARGYLPIPSVQWQRDQVALEVTLLAHGDAGASSATARYRVRNGRDYPVSGRLLLSILPYQVYPPWQGGGGISPIRRLQFAEGRALVNEGLAVGWSTPPSRVGAVPARNGVVESDPRRVLAVGTDTVEDATGCAGGALAYDFSLAPGESAEWYLTFPLHEGSPGPVAAADAPAHFAARQKAMEAVWEELTGRVSIDVPEPELVRLFKANAAYNLVTRDGAALQPGSRSYDKAWMRDGAIAAHALLGAGLTNEALAFVEWMAGFQQPSGEIPPVVDTKAEDPLWEEKRNGLVEYDAQGQFIWAVRECYRFTRDEAFLRRLFPHVESAMKFMEELRGRRLTAEYRDGGPDKRIFHGLLPNSNSHEGYYMKHSYWDDFWALRGWKDGAALARAVGRDDLLPWAGREYGALRESVHESMFLVMRGKGIDFIPGCAELGDYDATASTVLLTYCEENDPKLWPAIQKTLDKYRDEVVRPRLQPGVTYRYTPYEWRNIPALIRVDRQEEAWTLLRFLFEGSRPRAWGHFAEVVHSDLHFPTYIGDMPHTWIGTEFMNAFRSFLVYENKGLLVLGHGLPAGWLDRGGVTVRRLPTAYGHLDYRLEKKGDIIRLQVKGETNNPPPDGYAWVVPATGDVVSVTVNGAPAARGARGEIAFDRLPADLRVTLKHADP